MTQNFDEELMKGRSSAIDLYSKDEVFLRQSAEWVESSMRRRYVYNFDWLGRPIIQYPQDIVAMQELIWSTKPDLIIETGIAHGGSLMLSASLLSLLDYCDAVRSGAPIDPYASTRKVLGIDIDIRSHNRDAIQSHAFSHKIEMIQGSSVAPETIDQVRNRAAEFSRVMVCLDSNHTRDHVFAELEAYATLTTVGCYCVVFDTFVDDVPSDVFPGRDWSPGNSPKTAVHDFLARHPEMQIDESIHQKLLITAAPDGYLRRLY